MKVIGNRGVGAISGYTIVEVMIFLAVSGGLLLSANGLISGKQERTRFSNGIGDIETQILDEINNVTTGYYPTQENFNCVAEHLPNLKPSSTYDLSITPGANQLGTNGGDTNRAGCLYVGRLLARDNSIPAKDEYRIYTIVGGKRSSTFTATSPSNVGSSPTLLGVGTPGIVETKANNFDIRITRIIKSGGGTPYYAFSIIADFGDKWGISDFNTGSGTNISLKGFKNPIPTAKRTLVAADFDDINSGLTICLQQGNGRKAALKITQKLGIEKLIDSVPTECP